MNNNAKNISVDVLIPCYNCEKYISCCLYSVINQDYPNLNIIVANDGSTDNSLNIIQDIINKNYNKKITLINQENKGLSVTRNVLIKNAISDYIYFLDSDDWIEKDCISSFVELVTNEQDLILGSSCYIDKLNKSKLYYLLSNKVKNKDDFLNKNTLFAWNHLIKRSFILENNLYFYDKFSFFEDAGIMSFIVFKANKVSILTKPKYHYCFVKGSLSHSKITKYKIESSIEQLKYLYTKFKSEEIDKLPKSLNNQIVVYHCIIFTYIHFSSNISSKEKKE